MNMREAGNFLTLQERASDELLRFYHFFVYFTLFLEKPLGTCFNQVPRARKSLQEGLHLSMGWVAANNWCSIYSLEGGMHTVYCSFPIRLFRSHSVGKLTVKTGSRRPRPGKCNEQIRSGR